MHPAEPGALLLLVNGVDPERLEEYEAWHGTEHVPERLTMPGFLAADRYVFADDPCRFATIYWLDDARSLYTPDYLNLMANPSPWSARMRPAMRDVTRWPALVRDRHGKDAPEKLALLSYRAGLDFDALTNALHTPIISEAADGWALAEWLDAPSHPSWSAGANVGHEAQFRCFIGAGKEWLPSARVLNLQQEVQFGDVLHLSLIARIRPGSMHD